MNQPLEEVWREAFAQPAPEPEAEPVEMVFDGLPCKIQPASLEFYIRSGRMPDYLTRIALADDPAQTVAAEFARLDSESYLKSRDFQRTLICDRLVEPRIVDVPLGEADFGPARKEVEQFRDNLTSQAKVITAGTKGAVTEFDALRTSINRNAQVTRGALAQALLEGRKNIGGLVSDAKTAQKEFEALENAEEKALKLASGSGGPLGTLKSALSGGLSIAGGVFGGNLLTGAVSRLTSGI